MLLLVLILINLLYLYQISLRILSQQNLRVLGCQRLSCHPIILVAFVILIFTDGLKGCKIQSMPSRNTVFLRKYGWWNICQVGTIVFQSLYTYVPFYTLLSLISVAAIDTGGFVVFHHRLDFYSRRSVVQINLVIILSVDRLIVVWILRTGYLRDFGVEKGILFVAG